jgi:hypothetical protein
MTSITTSEELKAAIQELELQQARELILLKEQFEETKEGFKLINIIKGTFKKAVSSPELKTDALNAAIGFTTGILAKKLMIGKTINPFKKILGIVLEMTVANKVAKNADGIKSVGGTILNMLFRKKKDPVNYD